LTALAGFKPLVTMTWGSDLLVDADRNPLWSLVTQYTLKRTAVMVGDCQAVRNKAVRLGFPSERIVTFPWGVDLDRFQPGESTLKNRLGWGDCFVILSLRSWEPIYGVELLVSAFLRAAQVVPQLRLILLGDGSRRESIRTLLANSGLEERVYLGGLTENEQLPEYYRAADVYVSASYSDGSSVSLMEALACGLPVLVSDIPGNCEWVQEGEQGWLFPTGDEDALASAMVKAYEQRDDMPHMAQACRTLAEARADWNKNFQGLLAAYELAAGYRQGI
jgi:L-malate glycosyltransferase